MKERILEAMTTVVVPEAAKAMRDEKVAACIERMGRLYVLHPDNKVVRTPRYPLLTFWLAHMVAT